METPFVNDPFSILMKAFHELYPAVKVNCYWTELENVGYGYTNFCNDGTVEIHIDPNHSVAKCIDTLAHELIHAALGLYHGHDETWSNSFEELHNKYDEICKMYMEGQNGTE